MAEHDATDKSINATDINALLKKGTYKTTKPSKGKSDIWKSFSVVCDSEGKHLPFVSCDKCNKVLTYSGHKSGTSGLRCHVCTVLKGQTSLTFMSNQSKVSSALKDATTTKCVDFVCADIRPYDTVSGQGFIKLTQHLVDTAAKIGKFNVTDILPHPTTVSRNLSDRAQTQRRAIVDEMTDTIVKYGCAISTDIWTENYRKTSFLSSTIHYIDANYDLVSRVLFAAPFEAGISKTGENICAFLFQNLRVFVIDCSQAKKIVFVTDRGANMVAALRGFRRLNCSAHVLNVILSHAFSSSVLDKTPEIDRLLKDVKKLVTYFKHSGLQAKLSKSLKQSVETRWNSNFEMLDSVLQQYDDIATILLENKQYDKVGCINKNTLKTLVTFLKPFKDATNDLESDNMALSGSLVLPWSVRLRNHCNAAVADCLLTNIASSCVQRLDELMSPNSLALNGVHMLYKTATFLTPKLRQLKMIDDNERQSVIQAVKVLIDELGIDEENSEEDIQPSAKKPAFQDFAELEDSDTTESYVSLESEIAAYLNVKLDASESHGPKDVLQWWKRRCQEFPRLSQLTRYVLCIPASSAPSERAFSICGHILEQRRINLKPSSVNDILFLHGLK